MSLTSFLEISEYKKKFNEEFIKPKFEYKQYPILIPPKTTHYGLIGTAFDYLLRFYIQRLNSQAIAKEWMANEGVILANGMDRELGKIADEIMGRAEESHAKYLQDGILADELIASIIGLAKLEIIFRSSMPDDNLSYIDELDVQDLKELYGLLKEEDWKTSSVCYLNPEFGPEEGEVSGRIGGADADLIIDDTIIDIKSSKKLEITRRFINQMMGYYTLFQIGQVPKWPKGKEIKRIGFYFSRYGAFYYVDIKDILKPTFPEFKLWLENTITVRLSR